VNQKRLETVQYGAMVEPLSVAMHAVEQSGMKKGDTALVLGAGPIGCFVIKTLIAQGARYVFSKSSAKVPFVRS
jgi:(R,R)-butanediol dehydrogenase/meso-butanediol dehydrogenase/diacetyl reductase